MNVGKMIFPTPQRDFAPSPLESAVAKERWGAGRIILPAFLN